VCILRGFRDQISRITVHAVHHTELGVHTDIDQLAHPGLQGSHDVALIGENRDAAGAPAEHLVRVGDEQLRVMVRHELERTR